jgi:hypothetical protein
MEYGDPVRIALADGTSTTGWFLGERDGQVWVCGDHEWAISEREFRDPRGTAHSPAAVTPIA